eukprot:TRINITY_DN3886_c0_g1_i2.p1 TRINITY_DN3886_c0_g1~~TRINITY_DN3886_c0_g1_i2.p1  ORF type:complete len:398 (+),score=30.99 TRINITY_DN3886_c0_g1_i2:131-1195(+)
MATPCFLLHTLKGSPQNLTVDLCRGLDAAEAVHLNLSDVLDQYKALKGSNLSLDSYFCLSGKLSWIGIRDPSLYNEASTGGCMAVSLPGGFRQVKAEEYMELIDQCKPEFFVGPNYDLPHSASAKRTRKCVDSCIQWHRDGLKAFPSLRESMFAAVQGISSSRDRIRCAREAVDLDPFGFYVGGQGLDESLEQRQQDLIELKKILPKEKPRLVVGIGAPDEVLYSIRDGIDVFVSTYPNDCADLGIALCFSLVPTPPTTDANSTSSNTLNLRDQEYELDTRPLVEACGCYTCQHHTRAYIHHLLNTHEMLAGILLILHNCRHYAEFFRSIRYHLDHRSFQSFMDRFLASYHSVS